MTDVAWIDPEYMSEVLPVILGCIAGGVVVPFVPWALGQLFRVVRAAYE